MRIASRSTIGLVTILAALAVAVIAPSAASAAGWLPWFPISAPGEDDSESFGPQVAFDPQGDATLVWQDQQPQGLGSDSYIRARTYFADGSVGPTRTLSAADSFDPHLGVDDQGVATVTWSRDVGGFSLRIQYIRLDAAGGVIGIPQQLSPGSDNANGEHSVAVNSSGAALAAWTNSDEGEAQFRRIAADGTLGTVTDLSNVAADPDDFLQEMGEIAIDDQGRGFAAWRAGNQDPCCTFRVEGRTIDADDALDPIRVLSNQTFFADNPEAVIDSQGKGTAAWDQPQDASPNTSVIYGNHVDAAGNAGATEVLSDPTLLSDSDYQGVNPVAAITPTDAVTVAYEESGPSDDAIRTRQISSTGALGSLNPIAIGDVDIKDVAHGSGGGGIVMYTAFPDGGSFYGASARPIDGAGVATGTPELLSEDEADADDEAVVAVAPGGDALAAWVRNNPDFPFDDYEGVEAAFFDATAPEVTASVPPSGTSGQSLVMGAVAEDRSNVTFSWNFGDGSPAQPGQIVQHAYAAPGTYTATVTATDEAGNSASVPTQVEVGSGGGGGGGGAACGNTITGTGSGERLLGTRGGDHILGLGGPDRLLGRAGADCLEGGGGGDRLKGGRGSDLLLGQAGRDRLSARGGGADLVDCGGGRDRARVDARDTVVHCERVRRR